MAQFFTFLTVVLILIFGAAYLYVSFLFAFSFLRLFFQYLQSLFWSSVGATVEAKVIRSEPNTFSGMFPRAYDKPIVYEPTISYTYTVNGQTYFSKKIGFVGKVFNTREAAERFINKLTKKRLMVVYYNPRNPQEVVITRKVFFDIVGGLMLGLIILSPFIGVMLHTFTNS